jgi:hypothetical protein
LLNILLNSAIPTYLALYAAHRESRQEPPAALAAISAFLGIGIFFATNRAFPMLALSGQYAHAATEAQRAALEAAGLSMLSVGQSHTPGTFMAFILVELAGVLISFVMLRGVFGGRSLGEDDKVQDSITELSHLFLGIGLGAMLLSPRQALQHSMVHLVCRFFQLGGEEMQRRGCDRGARGSCKSSAGTARPGAGRCGSGCWPRRCAHRTCSKCGLFDAQQGPCYKTHISPLFLRGQGARRPQVASAF